MAETYIDDTNNANGFGGGAHTNTQWDAGNSWIEMDATGLTNGFATFTSRIIDAGSNAQWDSISWNPQRPSLKELPNNNGIETEYAFGNLDMSETIVLLHLNDDLGATTFTDTSGNSNTGSCDSDANDCPSSTSSGKFSNAFFFDGVDDSIELPSQPVSSLIADEFTISFWVHPGAIADRPTFGFTNSGGWNDQNPIASYDGVFNIGDGAFSTQFLSALPEAEANTWTHYAIVDTGTHYVRYVNGVEIASTAITVNPSFVGNRIFTIGQSGFDPFFDDHFNGIFDEFLILGRDLSETEVLDMYKRGALRLNFQVRSCNDGACVGENFSGPDGTEDTFYSELVTSTTSTPSKAISISRNRYFQYRTMFQTSSSTLSPEITSVSIENTGAGVPGVTVTESGGSTDTSEAGGVDTYTIVLDEQPIDPVSILVTPEANCSVSTSTLLFTSSNWETAKTVTTSAIDNDIDEGISDTCVITHSATSDDIDYDNFDINSVTSTITDNDVAGVSIVESGGSTAITEAGGTDTYTVVLNSEPTANVTFSLGVDSDISVSTSTIVFTSANWDTPITVTVSAVNDAIDEDAHTGTITHETSSFDLNYFDNDIDTIVATITDNDTSGITITESGGTTVATEGGATDSLTIVLDSAPTSTVTISLTGDADVSVSTSSIAFTSGNWDDAVTVTVTAVNDIFVEGNHTGTIDFFVASDSDTNYDGFVLDDISISITDNDSVAEENNDNGTQEDTGGGAPVASAVPIAVPQIQQATLPPVALTLSLRVSQTFRIGGGTHTIKQLGSATDEKILVRIQSEPIDVDLQKNQAKRIDITGDGIEDIEIRYAGRIAGKSQVSIQELSSSSSFFSINNRAKKTSSRQVTLSFFVQNVSSFALSENKNFEQASFIPYVSTLPFTLSSGSGSKTIFVRFRSSAGGIIEASQTITYDPTLVDVRAPAPSLGTAPTSPLSQATLFTRLLTVGSKGSDVMELQRLLQSLGYMPKGELTTLFGARTRAGVIAFQKAVGIDPVGHVGPATRAQLNSVRTVPETVAIEIKPTGSRTVVNASPTGVFQRFLGVGSTGSDVRRLQELLQSNGFMQGGVLTNYFGFFTRQGVVAFQNAHGIEPLGHVGPATRQALNALIQ